MPYQHVDKETDDFTVLRDRVLQTYTLFRHDIEFQMIVKINSSVRYAIIVSISRLALQKALGRIAFKDHMLPRLKMIIKAFLRFFWRQI